MFNLQPNESPRTDGSTIYFPETWARCTVGKEHEDLVTSTLCHETFHVVFDTLEKDQLIYKVLVDSNPDEYPSLALWWKCVDMLVNIHDDSKGFEHFRHLKDIYKLAYKYWIKTHYDIYMPHKEENFWSIFFLLADIVTKGVFTFSEFPEYNDVIKVLQEKKFQQLLSLAKPKAYLSRLYKELVIDPNPTIISQGISPLGLVGIIFARLLVDKMKDRTESLNNIADGSVVVAKIISGLKDLPQFGVEMLTSEHIRQNLVNKDMLRESLSILMKQRTEKMPDERFNTRNIVHVKSDIEKLYEGEKNEDFYDENWSFYFVIDRSGSMSSSFGTSKRGGEKEETHLDIVKDVLLQTHDVVEELSAFYNLNHKSIGIAYDTQVEKFEITPAAMTKIQPRGGTTPRVALEFVKKDVGVGRTDCVIIIFLSDGQFGDDEARELLKIYSEVRTERKSFIPVLITEAAPEFNDPHFKYVARNKAQIAESLFCAVVSGYSDLI